MTPPAARMQPFDYLLYGLIVAAWSTSWIGMHWQVGVPVAPEVSIFWRFLIAGLCMAALALARGESLRLPLRQHPVLAAMGLTLFCTNFALFYHGALAVPSGLLSVVFSMASVVNLVLGFLVFRQRPGGRVLAGALVGCAGIGLLYAPQILGAGFDHRALAGLLFCLLGTLSFCLGNMASTASQRAGMPVIAGTAIGMLYGACWIGGYALLRGYDFTLDTSPLYLGSLLFLALSASVLAFWAYLTLLGRIGAARASYTTVMFPIVALAISTVFEGYVWTPVAMLGAVLALAGNILVLGRSG